MTVVVDTSVPVVANGRDDHPPRCVKECAIRIEMVVREEVLVVDRGRSIIREYMGNLRSDGQPGPGDAFLKWVLINQANEQRIHCVDITPTDGVRENYREFPESPALDRFDPSDRKFVAVSRAHPEHPPIMVALDTDWWEFREAFKEAGVGLQLVCPDELMQYFERRQSRAAQ